MMYAADYIHAAALILRLEDDNGKEVLFVFVEHMCISLLWKVIIQSSDRQKVHQIYRS